METTNDKSDSIIKELMKQVPLKSRIKVTLHGYFLKQHSGHFFISLDENGNANQEQVETNRLILEKYKPLMDAILEDIESWEKDGKPE